MNTIKIKRHCFKWCGKQRCACNQKGTSLKADQETLDKLWKEIWKKLTNRNDAD